MENIATAITECKAKQGNKASYNTDYLLENKLYENKDIVSYT